MSDSFKQYYDYFLQQIEEQYNFSLIGNDNVYNFVYQNYLSNIDVNEMIEKFAQDYHLIPNKNREEDEYE